MAVDPVKKAICVAAPEPAIVAEPADPVESVAQYQYEEVAFHFKISSAWQPPRSLSPSDVTSSPELFDVTEVVPVVVVSSVMESADTVNPFPAPICIVVAPGPVPPVKPEPAVSEVNAYVPTLFESRRVPVLPSSRLISVADAVIWLPAMNRLVTLALPATSRLYEGSEVPIPRFPPELSHHKLLFPVSEETLLQKVTWPATPDPAFPDVPKPEAARSCHITPL